MKTIFITGAVRNTGFAIARKFASCGYNVCISSRNADDAQKAAEKIESEFAVKAKGYGLDLKDPEDIKRVFAKILSDFGSLDVFVANSANLGIGCGVFDTDPDSFDDIMAVNAKGTFFCCQEAAKIMKKQRSGAIITIGSVQGTGAIRGRVVYGMTKAALSVLVKYIANELGEYHVRVNNIVAGAIHSERWEGISDEEAQRRRSRYPLGKEASEEDIANAAYFLGTDLSANITGIDLTIDAGLSTCLLPYTKSE